jgi:hypothetical protein
VVTVPSCDARRLLALHTPGCASCAAHALPVSAEAVRSRSPEAPAEDTPVSACFLLAAYSRYSALQPYCWVRCAHVRSSLSIAHSPVQLRSTSCDLPHETAERSSLPLELHTTQCWRERGAPFRPSAHLCCC